MPDSGGGEKHRSVPLAWAGGAAPRFS